MQGDLLYTQEQRGKEEIVSAYHVTTGEPIWTHRDRSRFWDSHVGAGPRATPAVGDGRVYTLGATGILNALNAASGDLVWSRNAASDARAELPLWGFVSSPLVVDDVVIVYTDALAAYDLATGEPRWSGPGGGGSHSSPQLLTIDSVVQVALVANHGLVSVAPADGTLLWQHPWSPQSDRVTTNGKRVPRRGWNGWVMRTCGASAASGAVWSSDEGCRGGERARRPAMDPRATPRPDLLHPRGAQRGDPRAARRAQRPADEEGRRQPPRPLRATRPPRPPTLPADRYVLALWKRRRVNIDYHVLVECHAYSLPFQLLREQVEVRYTSATVEIPFKGRRVTSHRRRYDGQPSTVAEHMPSAHRAHAEWTPSRLIRWAEKVGPATGRLVDRILRSRPHPEQGYRAVLGIMRLGRQHGNDRLDAASARALGSCRFDTVRNILAAGQDRLPFEPPAETTPTPAHDNIRGADYYAATTQEYPC